MLRLEKRLHKNKHFKGKKMIKRFLSLSVLLAMFAFIGCTEWRDSEDDNSEQKNTNTTVQETTYTVTFFANDGTNKSYTQTFVSGESQLLNENCFTRTGYDFASWNTKRNGYGTVYPDRARLTATYDIILYAQWTYVGGQDNPDNPVKTYTVTFYSNDGTDKSYTQTFVSGQSQNLNVNCFTRIGYTFAGWNTSSGGYGTSYSDKKAITIYSDKTLYAQWTYIGNEEEPDPNPNPDNPVQTYTVTFYSNDGTDKSYTQTLVSGQSQYLNANCFTRDGYVFAGWNTASDGLGTSYNDTGLLWAEEIISDMALYAIWEINTYTVKFDANGGYGEMSDICLTYEVSEQLPINVFYRSGYTFAGWAITSNGNVFYTDEEDVLNITTKDKTTMTLYAVWKENKSGISITLPSTNDVQINLKQVVNDEKVMFSVKTGFDSYAWYIDGKKQSETTATFTIDTSIMNPIIYKIMVIVADDDEYYSATADLEVKN